MPDEGQGRRVPGVCLLFVCFAAIWALSSETAHAGSVQCQTKDRNGELSAFICLFVCLFAVIFRNCPCGIYPWCTCSMPDEGQGRRVLDVYLFCGHMSPLFINRTCRIYPWYSCSMPDEGQGRRVLVVCLFQFVCLFVLGHLSITFFRNCPCMIYPWRSCSIPDEGQGQRLLGVGMFCLLVCFAAIWILS